MNPTTEKTDTTDEMDLKKIFQELWKHRKWIAIGTALSIVAGVALALLLPSRYQAQATFVLKEYGKSDNSASLLSQLGGVGGAVASQLGAGNTTVNKVEVILRGHELAESVILKNNLLPHLFPKKWDSEKGTWKPMDHKKKPTVRGGGELLRKRMLAVNVDTKKSIIRLSMTTDEPVLAKKFVDYYVDGLNQRIQDRVVTEARMNREFLERQLTFTTDPILTEKINNLIASEIEKMMFASAQSLEMLEGPIVPLRRASPQRTKIVMLAFILGLLLSSAGVFAWKSMRRAGTGDLA